MSLSDQYVEEYGLKIHTLNMKDSLRLIEEAVISRTSPVQHIVVNVAKLVNAQKDPQLRAAINNSDLVNIDGLAVAWVLRWHGHHVQERVAGIDLFQNLIKLCSEKGFRPYFLGAKPDVVKRIVDVFQERFPLLQIAGYRDGYFSDDDAGQVAEDIRSSQADMLFVAITSPKKELFLDTYTSIMAIPFSMGVGGSFDVISGSVKRAPVWMQKYGMEWFFRVLQEPRRMWRRYAVTNTTFLFLVLRRLLFKRRGHD